jgi:hypothetical protein
MKGLKMIFDVSNIILIILSDHVFLCQHINSFNGKGQKYPFFGSKFERKLIDRSLLAYTNMTPKKLRKYMQTIFCEHRVNRS